MKQKFFTHIRMLLLFAACFYSISAWAQTNAISGRVTGSDSGALPGATVLERGTSNGVSTNADGAFSLSVQPGATLVISSVGYTAQTITVGSQNVINVTLAAAATQLNEAIVVGYGSQSKSELTGAVTQLSAKDVVGQPVVSFEQAIQGRTPGVAITNSSGKLGAGLQIRVRGSASITASSQPLYVIDGIPVTSQDVGLANDEPINPLADLNPTDSESITILKDAASSAIYGSRASNGVVLVTTKKGRQGQTRVNVGYYAGTSRPTRERKFLNAAQFKELFTEAAKNEGLDAAEEFEAETGTKDFTSNNDSDWAGAAFQKGSVYEYNANVSGGDAKTRFFLSTTYNDQTGIILGNRYRRGSGRINVDHAISDKIKVGLNLSVSRSLNDRTPDDNSFSNPLQLNAIPPVQAIRNPQTGKLNDQTLYYNNLIDLDLGSNKATTNRSFSSLSLAYEPVKGLTLRTENGADYLNLNEELYRGQGTLDGGADGYGYNAQAQVLNVTTNNTATYGTTLNEMHRLEVLVGQSYQQSETRQTAAEGRGFPTPEFTKVASAAIKTAGNQSSGTGFTFLSFFGRVNYAFRDKYLVSGSVRRDGSSRFGKDNPYGTFGAGSVGWLVSEESFLKDNRILSLLKLRASIVSTGNAEIGNFDSRRLVVSLPYADQSGTAPQSQIGNPNLSWETTVQTNVGLEFDLFKGRIAGEIDLYRKNTTGLLLDRQLAYTSGYSVVTENVGELQNQGLEIGLNTRNLDVAGFAWTTNFNISFNRNKITKLPQEIIAGGRNLGRVRQGQPIGVFWGKKFLGADPANGDALYEGADGKPTNSYSAALTQKLGDPNPDYTGGLTNTFSYKGVDLSILTQFVYGNDLYNVAGVFQGVSADYFDNQSADQLNRWTTPGQITQVPQARLYAGNGGGPSSRWIQDGSFLRFKTITLGYNLPAAVAKRAFLQSARFYVTAQNPFTITNYDGYDPEVNSTAFNGTSGTSAGRANYLLGHDFYTPPLAKSFLAGLNLGF